jgi:uncharacterized membrane protein YbhN (UPF0104 family)
MIINSTLKRIVSGFIGVAVFIAAIYVLHHSLHAIHFSDVETHIRSISLIAIAAAIGCMVGSYILLTCYD